MVKPAINFDEAISSATEIFSSLPLYVQKGIEDAGSDMSYGYQSRKCIVSINVTSQQAAKSSLHIRIFKKSLPFLAPTQLFSSDENLDSLSSELGNRDLKTDIELAMAKVSQNTLRKICASHEPLTFEVQTQDGSTQVEVVMQTVNKSIKYTVYLS